MATSAQLSFRTALHTALTGRANLSNVQVFRYPADPRAGAVRQDIIWLGNERGEQAIQTMGGGREEEWELVGGVFVERVGNGDAKALEAHTRAVALLAEVEGELRDDPTVTASVLFAGLTGWQVEHDASDKSRICTVEFTITTVTRLT